MAATPLTGTFEQVIYSPRGGVEGFVLSVDGKPVQFVLDRDDEKSAILISSLAKGQRVAAAGDELPPSPKGVGAHPVRAFRKVLTVDGAAPKKIAPKPAGYSGKIVRLNFARHGAPNGFVLDTGDFVHVRPDGFSRLDLTIGDRVDADGDAHFLSTGNGWAVEATSVNGKALR